jgi:transformation/transcription domain-associated protein
MSSERLAAQLQHLRYSLSNATSVGDITRLVGEIRDRIEIVHTAEYANFLENIFPPLRDLIRYKTREQLEDNPENRIRRMVLDIFHKFPGNEVLRPHVYEIMQLSLRIVEGDNEDNACIALKIILDLHKTYRPALDSYVQPFLDLVIRMYENMHTAAKNVLSTPPLRVSRGDPYPWCGRWNHSKRWSNVPLQ